MEKARIMSHFIRICLMACIGLWGCLAHLEAQISAQNATLRNLMEALADYQVAEDFSGETFLPVVGNDKPLIVHRDKRGAVDHIGVKLFDRDLMQRYPSPLYEFVERYFLELLLERDEAAISDRLHLERIKISSDVPAAGNYKKWLRDIIAQCSPAHSIHITCNNNRYHICETDNQRTVFSMYLPVRYELITGFTKLEAERAVYDALLRHTYVETRQPAEGDYFPTEDGDLYCLNEEYYGTEEIISTSYYRKESGEFKPVFSAADRAKSVYNLFNVAWNSPVPVEVTQKLYGNQTLTYEVTVGRLTNYLRQAGCSLYTGIQEMEGDTVRGVVMAVNAELGYQHFMSFTLAGALGNGASPGTVKMSMYSYIPIHNVSALLESNK
jgi:hypothetical protein